MEPTISHASTQKGCHAPPVAVQLIWCFVCSLAEVPFFQQRRPQLMFCALMRPVPPHPKCLKDSEDGRPLFKRETRVRIWRTTPATLIDLGAPKREPPRPLGRAHGDQKNVQPVKALVFSSYPILSKSYQPQCALNRCPVSLIFSVWKRMGRAAPEGHPTRFLSGTLGTSQPGDARSQFFVVSMTSPVKVNGDTKIFF